MSAQEYRLIIVSGPTREWIDPVRFLSNASSGRTGWHLATHGKDYFRDVTYISGPVADRFQKVAGVTNIQVETTADMARAVQNEVSDRAVLIMAAAPADYTPEQLSPHKIKKSGNENITLKLKPTTDILKSLIPLSTELKSFYRIGFAAETENIEDYAGRKLQEKNLDFICANAVYQSQTGFGDTENTLIVFDRSLTAHIIGPHDKETLTRKLIDYIIHKLSL